METEVVVALVGGGFGLAGTIGGTLLGMYVNGKSAVRTALQLADVERHKHAQSRIWDAKKDAYTGIIVQLNEIAKSIEQTMDILFDPDIDPTYYLDSEDRGKDNALLWQRIWKLDDTVSNNSLILPDTFQLSFADWRKEFSRFDEDTDPREVAIIQSKAIDEHKPILIQMAKDELAATPTSKD